MNKTEKKKVVNVLVKIGIIALSFLGGLITKKNPEVAPVVNGVVNTISNAVDNESN